MWIFLPPHTIYIWSLSLRLLLHAFLQVRIWFYYIFGVYRNYLNCFQDLLTCLQGQFLFFYYFPVMISWLFGSQTSYTFISLDHFLVAIFCQVFNEIVKFFREINIINWRFIKFPIDLDRICFRYSYKLWLTQMNGQF